MADELSVNALKCHHLVAAGTSADSTLIKAGAGELFGYEHFNCVAALKYLHYYDKATAPTVGTDVPFMTLVLPFGASSAGFRIAAKWDSGIKFDLGLGMGITTTAADTGATGVTAADVVANTLYV